MLKELKMTKLVIFGPNSLTFPQYHLSQQRRPQQQKIQLV